MSHTKEPWSVDLDQPFPTVIDMAGNEICHTEEEANARRIVACVNACAGIPIDMLEAMPSGPAALAPMYARLEQQRDELLAALEKVLPAINDIRDVQVAKATIAKVKRVI